MTNKAPTNEKKHLILRLWKYIKPYKLLAFAAFTLTVLSNILSLAGPLLSGYAIDVIEQGTGKVDFNSVIRYI
ncbi:MAG TPA: ABC transporter ATP-binding protein, partial [Clostridia bacterium]|nr:ABC transporter ATP-binding protein [Clostridia bacterium]